MGKNSGREHSATCCRLLCRCRLGISRFTLNHSDRQALAQSVAELGPSQCAQGSGQIQIHIAVLILTRVRRTEQSKPLTSLLCQEGVCEKLEGRGQKQLKPRSPQVADGSLCQLRQLSAPAWQRRRCRAILRFQPKSCMEGTRSGNEAETKRYPPHRVSQISKPGPASACEQRTGKRCGQVDEMHADRSIIWRTRIGWQQLFAVHLRGC